MRQAATAALRGRSRVLAMSLRFSPPDAVTEEVDVHGTPWAAHLALVASRDGLAAHSAYPSRGRPGPDLSIREHEEGAAAQLVPDQALQLVQRPVGGGSIGGRNRGLDGAARDSPPSIEEPPASRRTVARLDNQSPILIATLPRGDDDRGHGRSPRDQVHAHTRVKPPGAAEASSPGRGSIPLARSCSRADGPTW